MLGSSENSRFGLALLLSFFEVFLGQQHFPSTVKHEAKRLYDMHLDLRPTSVRILRDPRYSSEVIPLYDLAFMSFQPRSEIRRISDVTKKVNYPSEMADSALTVTDETSLPIPNNVGLLPENSLDRQPPYVIWVASGSYGPSSAFPSSHGGIYLIDLSADQWKPVPIYSAQHVGFSHAEWIDMDLDGKKDCVTIQGELNRASLIWLRQPSGEKGTWQSQPISNVTIDVGGTDFKLMKARMPRRPNKFRTLIVVAGKRTAALTIYWVDDYHNDWTLAKKIKSTVIARSESYINIEIVDLNADGNDEILTSVAAVGNKPGRILAFEMPKSGFGMGGEWRRRILHEWTAAAVNYRTLTPGPAYVFTITSRERQASRKPHILVSGADDGKAYVLSPDSWSPYVWGYSLEIIFSGERSVGVPAVLDVDGDGYNEIFIPEGQTIHVMKYQESKAPAGLRSSMHLQTIVSLTLAWFITKVTFS